LKSDHTSSATLKQAVWSGKSSNNSAKCVITPFPYPKFPPHQSTATQPCILQAANPPCEASPYLLPNRRSWECPHAQPTLPLSACQVSASSVASKAALTLCAAVVPLRRGELHLGERKTRKSIQGIRAEVTKQQEKGKLMPVETVSGKLAVI